MIVKKLFTALAALLLATSALAYQILTPQGLMDVNFSNSEGQKPTYSAVIADFTPAATATDMVQIRASATKTVRITNICVSGDATGNSTEDIYLVKRTAANTGGTSAAVTITKYDSNDATPTASVVSYSVNPTGLGAGSLIAANHIAFPALTNPTVPVGNCAFTFGTRPARTAVLRAGTNEAISINWNGNAVPAGASLYMTIEWTEE